jgi:hypothetical protein
MSLIRALVGARINETSDNYARADQFLTAKPVTDTAPPPGTESYTNDELFWREILADKRRYLNKTFFFGNLVVSEWVARVPGLAWKPESQRLLELCTLGDSQTPSRVLILDGMRVYQPEQKSAHVMNGVGTLRLPPNTLGEWLFSVSSQGDASYGVPVLVSPDVWERIQEDNTCEGRIISGKARWQPMDASWSTHFRSTGDIPPGYFVLRDPDAIAVEDRTVRTWVYPFTIMEYQSDAAELFDYVYCGAHTDEADFRQGLEVFFEEYRRKFGGSYSRYLIAGDLVDGLWPADFNSPAELLSLDSSARSQLELLQERVLEHALGEKVIDELLVKMQRVLTDDDLVRLSSEVGIDKRVWQKTNTILAEQCSQFLAAVVAEKKQDTLMEQLAMQAPAILR